jgi:hypothetical protein
MNFTKLSSQLACSALALALASCGGNANTQLLSDDSGVDSPVDRHDAGHSDSGGAGHDSGKPGTDAGDAGKGGDAGPACTGSFICGNGSHGTVVNSSYVCSSGKIGAATKCAFGCDEMNGECADLVPANQAGTHLATGDNFTCTGTQSASLPDITAGAGDTLVFNTTAATVVLNGSATPIAGVLWGTSYTPTGGTAPLIVAHVKSLQLAAGATVTITGASTLALLVDTSVSIAGTSKSTTLIDLSAHYSAGASPEPQAGPGASFAMSSGAGTSGSSADESGGGGAGHGVTGGNGGDGNGGTTAVAGGPAFGTAFVLAAGGYGGGGYDQVGKGGGGLQISTCGDVSISADVIVNASGGGGKGGSANGSASPTGGYGGGSGGTLILEGATTSSLAGSLVANGGGGGQGAILGTLAILDGSDWSTSTPYNTPAPGGGVAAAARSGGAGGAGATAPVSAINSPALSAGGGGGGAYGAIYIADAPIAAKPSASASSPAPYYSRTCVTVDGVAPTSCTYTALP